MLETEALKSLGAFPLIQLAFAILIVGGGVYAAMRGTRDKNGSPPAIPQWLMMGPAHDAMRSVHEIAEQGRVIIHVLERIENEAKTIAKEQREQTQLLELIRNESRLR